VIYNKVKYMFMFIAAKENLKQGLTPSNRVHLQKLIIAQLVKKLLTSY
jgi:hypothetical protein